MTDHDAAAMSGVEHGDVLIAFAEAMVGDDDAALVQARQPVIEAMGPEAMVDAAAVASNFERMVRIADSTGIPLDERMEGLSKEVRDELHLERFAALKEMAETRSRLRGLDALPREEKFHTHFASLGCKPLTH